MAKYVVSQNSGTFFALCDSDELKQYMIDQNPNNTLVFGSVSDADFAKIQREENAWSIASDGSVTIGDANPVRNGIQKEDIEAWFTEHLAAAKEAKDNTGLISDIRNYYDTIKDYDLSSLNASYNAVSPIKVLADNSMECDKAGVI
jgi:hypothetical protein|tara:strand:+ start:320 stop:757 length:438 start_codon:yes stop_codon:yes gene_type:complete